MNSRLPLVSFFRGFAIIMVVLCHSQCHFELNDAISFPLDFCTMGCQIFFVMSSYCLCLSYNSKKTSAKDFYKRRLLSIVPGYWTILIINIIAAFLSIRLLDWPFPLNSEPKNLILNFFLLHGLTFDMETLNNVVFGGWFIGTMVVLYFLFPVLYRLYFRTNILWEKYRYIIFPAVCLLLDVILCAILDSTSGISCNMNTGLYYNVINQLPAFVCGFSLFDIMYKDESKAYPILSIIFLVLAIGSFKISGRFSYIFCPFLVAAFTVCAFRYFSTALNIQKRKIQQFVCTMGDKSYAIYLSHFWTVIAMVTFIRKFTFFGSINCSENMLYMIILPIILIVSYLLGVVFDKYLSAISRKIKFRKS